MMDSFATRPAGGTDQGMLFYIYHVLHKGKYRQTTGEGGVYVKHWWAHTHTHMYMFHMLQSPTPNATDEPQRQSATHAGSCVASHRWDHPKPWELNDPVQLGQRVDYFKSLDLGADPANVTQSSSSSTERVEIPLACTKSLREKREKALKQSKISARAVFPNIQNVFLAERGTLMKERPIL